MQSISLCDEITVENGIDGIEIICDDADIPSGENNLAYRAAAAFFDAAGISPSAKISIAKKIPSQAGLGGGSADAAGTLVALNTLYGEVFSAEKLCYIGAGLGADVPFCIIGGTALCSGIGEVITPLRAIPETTILIAKGEAGISTAEAYRNYDMLTGIIHPDVAKLVSAVNDGKHFSSFCKNVFEYTVFHADIDEIKETMCEFGASAACMTGSGSAVFGIFNSIQTAEKCRDSLKKSKIFSELCTPVSFGTRIIR